MRPLAEAEEASDMDMQREFTAVFKKVPEGYIGVVEEVPGANTQGATLEEARSNLLEALSLILESAKGLLDEELGTGEVVREPLRLPVG